MKRLNKSGMAAAEEYAHVFLEDYEFSSHSQAELVCHALVQSLIDTKELLAALEELHAYQNGPPLPSYTEGWTKAMAEAEHLIRKHKRNGI